MYDRGSARNWEKGKQVESQHTTGCSAMGRGPLRSYNINVP